MTEARVKQELDGSAIVASVVANVHSTKRFSPADFHPARGDERDRGRRLTRGNLGAFTKAITASTAKRKPKGKT